MINDAYEMPYPYISLKSFIFHLSSFIFCLLKTDVAMVNHNFRNFPMHMPAGSHRILAK